MAKANHDGGYSIVGLELCCVNRKQCFNSMSSNRIYATIEDRALMWTDSPIGLLLGNLLTHVSLSFFLVSFVITGFGSQNFGGALVGGHARIED